MSGERSNSTPALFVTAQCVAPSGVDGVFGSTRQAYSVVHSNVYTQLASSPRNTGTPKPAPGWHVKVMIVSRACELWHDVGVLVGPPLYLDARSGQLGRLTEFGRAAILLHGNANIVMIAVRPAEHVRVVSGDPVRSKNLKCAIVRFKSESFGIVSESTNLRKFTRSGVGCRILFVLTRRCRPSRATGRHTNKAGQRQSKGDKSEPKTVFRAAMSHRQRKGGHAAPTQRVSEGSRRCHKPGRSRGRSSWIWVELAADVEVIRVIVHRVDRSPIA